MLIQIIILLEDMVSRSLFSSLNFNWGKNVIVFWVKNKSSGHINNKKHNILTLSDGISQGLDDTLLNSEAIYSINFSRSRRKCCSSLRYNENINFFVLNNIKMYINSKQKTLKYNDIWCV